MALALRLHCSLDDVLNLPYSQFQLWIAYFELESENDG